MITILGVTFLEVNANYTCVGCFISTLSGGSWTKIHTHFMYPVIYLTKTSGAGSVDRLGLFSSFPEFSPSMVEMIFEMTV